MLAYASTLPMAARSTGTSFAVTLEVTTGAAAAIAATSSSASAATGSGR